MTDTTYLQLQREIEERKKAEQITRTLFSISNAVNTTENLGELYESIHRILGRILDLTNFFIAIYHKDSAKISFPYFADQFDAADTYADQLCFDNSLTGNTIRDGKPVFLDKDALLKRSIEKRIIGTTPSVWLGIPLFIQGEVIGVISTQSYKDDHNFSEKDLDILVAVSEQVALAIERKRNEQTLIASEERFRLAMDASQDGFWDWNIETDHVYYSPGYFTMLGYPPDHTPSDSGFWKEHVHPEDQPQSLKANNDCIQGRKNNFEMLSRMRTRDNRWLWIQGRGMVISHDKAGRALRIIGTHTDITRQKEMEDKLRASELKFRSMLEAMIDPLFICSPDNGIQYMNPAMEKRIGRDATGEHCYRALHSPDQQCPWCNSTYGNQAPFETDIVSPMDNRSYHISSSPIKQTNGSTARMTVLRDTTEMKQIQAQLQQARKIESIGVLAGGIAHDFNNVLTPIIGMSEILMLQLQPDSEEYENAGEILKAGQRASELVKQILAFSRQSDYQKQPTCVQSVLKEVMTLCRSTIPSSIKICDDIQLDAGQIEANESQIHQIALNLITNAYHAVEENSGRIDVELKEVRLEAECHEDTSPDQGHYIRLTVADTGIGMPQDVVDRIFDPYFTTKETGKGTGLGLATVYGIVKDHDAEIQVTSKLGQGTKFEIFFPRIIAGDDMLPPKHENNYIGGTERILVVDDEEPIARLHQKILERLGYQVTVRTSSREALKTYRENSDKFDLIIADMTMPDMTGDILAKKLLAGRPDLPIIICTGFSERISRENAKSLGAEGYLMKPIVAADLAKMVRNVLDGNQMESNLSTNFKPSKILARTTKRT